MDVGRIWAFLGCGISWVCCSSSAEKTRVPSFALPDSLSSFFLPGDPGFFPSSFSCFPGELCPSYSSGETPAPSEEKS